MSTLRHASFFSGVGGLDLGFERAGIKTVSVSEIDPYASSVLADRFPDAPNLGNIVEVNANEIPEADIYSGGFPCQDLSVAGKRAGFAGKRSSLAFTFLDLVEQRRPRWIVLENVPGLFSSNKGADFGRLLYEMEQLGYGVSWRILDARFFGVAQRRRRVFIVGSFGSDRSAEVLFECEGCERHPAPRWTQRQSATSGAPDGSGVARAIRASLAKRGERKDGTDDLIVSPAITGRFSKGVNTTIDEPLIISQALDSNRVRAADGMARRMDDQPGVETPKVGNFELYDFPKDEVAPSLNALRAKDMMIYQDRVADTLTAPTGGGRRDKIPMTLIQAVIQDSREMANKAQNGLGISTEDIVYTLTGIDRQAVSTESILSFPSRFGSNANVTENQAQSMAHSAGAPAVFRKAARAQNAEDSETWVEGNIANTLNGFDVGDTRKTHAIIGGTIEDDPMLPIGLDSHRYRCCGNGVVASVAEWIGRRIVEVDARWREEDK
jgi:DNA (cytosine-5)-methyltransferase 1